VAEAPRPLFVPTERIEALIRTCDQQLIFGKVHSQPGKRLKDEMNSDSSRFIAITDARVRTRASTTRPAASSSTRRASSCLPTTTS
jgi:hypothetical protein